MPLHVFVRAGPWGEPRRELPKMPYDLCFFERNYGRILAVAAFVFVAAIKLFA